MVHDATRCRFLTGSHLYFIVQRPLSFTVRESIAMKFSTVMKHPSAFVPVAMSAAALLVVAVAVGTHHAVPEPDEGTAAHLWQLLMGLQLPVVLWFAITW